MGGLTASAALFLAAANAGAGLRVETGTPAALCPDVAEVRRAVRERLNVEGEGEWLASYDLVHRPASEAGDIVRLELRDPAGRLRLQRELPRAGASCVALAQAVAMVLETYFRHPGEPIDAGAAPGATVAKTSAPRAPTEPPAPMPAGRGLTVGLLGAWAAGPSSPAVALDLSYGARQRWAVGIEGVLMTSEQARAIDPASGQGTGFLRSTLLHAWGAIRLGAGGAVELLAGPELALGIDRMRTANVPEGRTNVRAAWGVGARSELRIWLAPRVALSLLAAADYSPRAWAGRFQFEIEGVTTEPFPPPEARLLLGMGVGFLAFP
jgi:hypothetical protein